MNRIHPHLAEIDFIGKIADLKEGHYRNTVALSAIIELLVEKGILTMQELEARATDLDAISPETEYPIS
ncbi:hypothetical protein [Paenibacillus sp. y28]|uniref:hypothetical protein n=1 Tax=Paenibacillus sp. y28 TaxID=3129110 RepID=UPI0030181053